MPITPIPENQKSENQNPENRKSENQNFKKQEPTGETAADELSNIKSFSINQVSATVIELIANRVINLDPEARQKLDGFSEKVIHIHISDLDLNYYFLFPGGSLVVQEQCERPVAATISGKLSAFIAAASASNTSDAVFTGELHFSGEIKIAQRFQAFAQSLQIDWQESISKLFGDVAAYNIAKGINHVSQFVSNFLHNTRQDIPEYLQHEARATPSSSELNLFLEQVDLVRSQADRLQARIQRLQIND